MTVVCALAVLAPASSAAAITAWRKYVISSSSEFSPKLQTPAHAEEFLWKLSASSRIPSLCVRRLAHQFHFCLQHFNAPLRLGFGQVRCERLRLIRIERKLPKQRSLLGSHLANDVRFFRHGITIVPERIGSTRRSARMR